jgi:catalase
MIINLTLNQARVAGNPGVIIGDDPQVFVPSFTEAVAEHRYWNRKLNVSMHR